MKRKRHSTEQIIRTLREAEAIEASGQTPGQVRQRLARGRAAVDTMGFCALAVLPSPRSAVVNRAVWRVRLHRRPSAGVRKWRTH